MPLETILDRSAEAFAGIRKGMSNALMVIALNIESEAKQQITSGSKSGRTYRRRGIAHRSSALGEAPATDMGNLVNSIQAQRASDNEAQVNVGAGYGDILEEKRNRPFMKPAIDNVVERIPDIVKAAIDREIPG